MLRLRRRWCYSLFQEWLKENIKKDYFFYRHYGENISSVEVDDEDSMARFVGTLNEWHTQGYCYTSNFSFDSENIVFSGNFSDVLDNSMVTLLQKLLLTAEVDFDYTFDAYIPTAATAACYDASTVVDFICLGLLDFMEAYLIDYGYLEALDKDLKEYTQDEQDLAYCMALDCLERDDEKRQAIIASHKKGASCLEVLCHTLLFRDCPFLSNPWYNRVKIIKGATMDIMGTSFVELNDDERSSLCDLAEYGYVFDWTKHSSYKSLTVAALHNGDVAGLVEFERQPEDRLNYMWLVEVAQDYRGSGMAGKLLAYVARDSIEQGFDGFVLNEAKTALYELYIAKYGAISIGRTRLLYFDTEIAQHLIERYLGGE